MTALVPDLKERQRFARSRAGRIRSGITDYLQTLAVIATAYQERDWESLGYDGWDAYVDGEFGADRLRIPAEHRQKAIDELRLSGLSTRAIAPVVGVSHSTVARQVLHDATPEPVQGIDGKTYSPARSPVVEAMTGAIEDAEQRAQEHRADLIREEIEERHGWDADQEYALIQDHRGGTPGDPNPDPRPLGPVSDAAAGAYLPPAAAPMTERIEEDTDHPAAPGKETSPGEADVATSDSAPEGAGTSDHITPAPSGPPCEKCGNLLDREHWDLGYMRCEDCDPEGDHLAGAFGCQICVCPTCGKPRWSPA